ncbi:hypothetical protein R1sor_027261 [Riccia sorocarpa]|uniref:Uncharacterized protein n=1 Tax=Riccia sorocarpa TaxID=122646 RepID=A0ABD3GDR5_9MARC
MDCKDDAYLVAGGPTILQRVVLSVSSSSSPFRRRNMEITTVVHHRVWSHGDLALRSGFPRWLPADMVFDVRDLCPDSQPAFSVPTGGPLLSGKEEEAADREGEPIDLSKDDDVV